MRPERGSSGRATCAKAVGLAGAQRDSDRRCRRSTTGDVVGPDPRRLSLLDVGASCDPVEHVAACGPGAAIPTGATGTRSRSGSRWRLDSERRPEPLTSPGFDLHISPVGALATHPRADFGGRRSISRGPNADQRPYRRRRQHPRTTETRCSATVFDSTPGGTRTPNLLIRSQTLCPIELRAHTQPDGDRVRDPQGTRLADRRKAGTVSAARHLARGPGAIRPWAPSPAAPSLSGLIHRRRVVRIHPARSE